MTVQSWPNLPAEHLTCESFLADKCSCISPGLCVADAKTTRHRTGHEKSGVMHPHHIGMGHCCRQKLKSHVFAWSAATGVYPGRKRHLCCTDPVETLLEYAKKMHWGRLFKVTCQPQLKNRPAWDLSVQVNTTRRRRGWGVEDNFCWKKKTPVMTTI